MPNVSSASLSLAIPTETISAKSNVFKKLKASSGLWIPTARILFMIIFLSILLVKLWKLIPKILLYVHEIV